MTHETPTCTPRSGAAPGSAGLLLLVVERHQSTPRVTRFRLESGRPILGTVAITEPERVAVHPTDGEDSRTLMRAVQMHKIDGQRRFLRVDDLEGAGLDLHTPIVLGPLRDPLVSRN